MRADIRYYHDQITVPDDAKLGDTFVFTATAIVTSLEQELTDVTSYGRAFKTEILPSEQRAQITLTNPNLTHRDYAANPDTDPEPASVPG